MPSRPLVSCICPTMPGREDFLREAVACYEAQTYPCRELVIVRDPGTVGAKRNMAVSRSRGEIIAHWDDDDWSAPDRLEDQVSRLLETGAEITGYRSMLFRDGNGGVWLYEGPPNYALGTSLVYRRDIWRKRPFPHQVTYGEDNYFIKGRRIASVDAGCMMWARIHPGNTSDKAGRLEAKEYRKIT